MLRGAAPREAEVFPRWRAFRVRLPPTSSRAGNRTAPPGRRAGPGVGPGDLLPTVRRTPLGTCPHSGTNATARAELVVPEEYDDDNLVVSEEGSIRLEQGAPTFQYVCPECDAILGAGTHKRAR